MNITHHTGYQVGNILISIAGVIVTALGFLVLLGWILRFPLLTSLSAGLNPMATSTAILFVMLGGALFFRNRFPQHHGTYLINIFIGSIVLAASLLLFFFNSAGTYPSFKHFGLSITGTLDVIPIEHMSPVAAICFVVSAISFLLTLSPSVERPKHAVAALVLACLIVLTALLHLIAYLFGSPLIHGGMIKPPSLLSSVAFFILALGLIGTAGLQIWSYSRIKDSIVTRVSYLLILIFIILASGFVTGGFFSYRNYEKNYRQELEHELSAIAELKVSQLVQYRTEWLGDASILYKNPSFSNLVRRFFEKANDAYAQHQLQTWLDKYKLHDQYHRVLLLDTLGVTRMSDPKEDTLIASAISNRISETINSGEITIQDFYRNENDQEIYLSVLVPILEEQHSNRAIGILVLVINPASYLYPFIQHWPTPRRTSESLVIRREGNDVLFLNELRSQKNTALTLRSPLTNINMIAVKAVLGKEGTVEGIDYRGVPVLANLHHIPDSPWFLVAQEDLSELYAPLRERLWQIVLFIGVLLVGTGAGVGLVWRHLRAHFYREKFQASEALGVSEEKYRRLIEFMPDGVVVHSEGRIVYANPSFIKIVGAESSAELIGNSVIDFVHPDYRENATKRIKQLLSEGIVVPVTEEQFIRLDGTLFTVEVSAVPISYGDKPAMLTVFNDITERKRAAEALIEQSRIFDAFFENTVTPLVFLDKKFNFIRVNKAYAKSGQRDISEFPGHNHFEFYPSDARAIFERVVETKESFQTKARPFCYPDHPEWGVTYWDWILTPILDNNGEVEYLVFSLNDVTQSKKSEEALRASEERFSTAFHFSPIPMAIYHVADGRIVNANDVFVKTIGYTREEIIGHTTHEMQLFADPADRNTIQQILRERGSLENFEFGLRKKSGEIVIVQDSAVLIEFGGEKHFLSLLLDITERRRAEEALKAASSYNRRLIEASPDPLVTIGPDGKITDVNEATETVTGVSREHLIGSDFTDYFTEPEKARNGYQQALAEGSVRDYPLTIQHISGRIIDVLYNAVVYENGEGQVEGIFAAARDITGQKKAEEVIRQYAMIVESSDDAIISKTLEGIILTWNKGAERIYGYSVDEVKGRSISILVPPEYPNDEVQILSQIANGEHIDHYETSRMRKDGRIIDVSLTMSPVNDATGRIVSASTIARDITERKRAEEALRAASSYNRRLIEASIDPLVTIGPDGKITDVNEATEIVAGVSRERLIGDDFLNYFTEPEKARDGYQKVLAKGFVRDYPLTIRHTSGKTTDVLYNATVYKNEIGEIQGVFAAARDITERKQAEVALQKSETRFRQTLDNMLEGCMILGFDWTYLYLNETAARHGRSKREDLIGRTMLEMYHGVEKSALFARYRRSMKERISQRFEESFTFADGTTNWFMFSVESIPEGIFVLSLDVTERKQVEEKLREASLYSRILIETSLDPLVTISPQGKITDVNQATEQVTGVSRDRLICSDFADYFTEPDQARVGYEQVFSQGTVKDYPLSIRHASGRITDVLYNASLYKNEAGEVQGIFAAARDITERKLAESQREAALQASKLAEDEVRKAKDQLEQLNRHLSEVREEERTLISREIHDELGQSLTALKIDLNWIIEQIDKKPAVQQRLNAMLTIVDGTIKDVQRIASDLRPSILDDLGLASAIEWYCEESERRSGIVCETDLEETQFNDPHKNLTMFRILQEALTNIIRHANATSVMVHLYRLGENLHLEIKDNGIGMSQEKIISGKSLGLIGMRERVKQFNGHLEIFSDGKKGTAITISLPIHS